jgi:2-oxoglutarate dehydrogenase E2 component (dihydrolipoamide succinyltransferase)
MMPTEIVVPELGESVLEATVLHWHKKAGERVATGDVVVELETDKVNLDVVAPQDGVLARIEHQEGADVQVGDVLGVIEEVAEEEQQPDEGSPELPELGKTAEPPEPEEGRRAPAPVAERSRATPVAQRMAEERGVDLAHVEGTGPAGRVTKEDVEGYLAREVSPGEKAPEPSAPSTAPAGPMPHAERDRREERRRMSRRRRTIARRLVDAQQSAAMLTTFNDVDMSGVMALRERHKTAFRERFDTGLGITSFFVKAAIGALKAFPRLNAEIQADEIVFKYYYDIGVAIGAADGLVVPVLRDADRMSFAEIEQAIKAYAQKAQDRTLSLEDLRGGTFTITNGGVFGSLLSTPILNPPQVGILGLHRIEERPIVLNGEIVARSMMYLALSYDHRIVDGREAVQFLVQIKRLIEDPEVLLLEG